MATILVNYPTRSRPHKFMKIMKMYAEKCSGNHIILFLIKVDSDDLSMNNPYIFTFLNKLGVKYEYKVLNDCKGKIDAINRYVSDYTFDIVMSIADDMEVLEQNWDERIVSDMGTEYNLCLNYNIDPRLSDYSSLIVLPIIGKNLYQKFGYIYHPSYISEYCDNEQTEVFEKMNAIKHIDSKLFHHDWHGNQDSLMQKNMQIGQMHDRANFENRKQNNFMDFLTPNNIVQITMTKNELFLLKEMLPIWKKYADGFVFMDDDSTDGTYEYLTEHAKEYNILAVLRHNKLANSLMIESNVRQRLFDEAIKYSGSIVCLDTDEYIAGTITKNELKNILQQNKDTLFYCDWIQYIGKNEIRIDGKWANHLADRVASYSTRILFKNAQNHAEHLPVPHKIARFNCDTLFIAHLQWLDKQVVAIKQYYWKIYDYVNNAKFGTQIIDKSEYDKSVNEFNWNTINFPITLEIRPDVYSLQNPEHDYKYQYIKTNVAKYIIPNLNDWGMGIH